MALVVPWPEDHTEPTIDVVPELITQRELTEWFIAMDPSNIILTPRIRTRTATGAYDMTDGTPRAQQQFKVISTPGQTAGANSGLAPAGTEGEQRKYDYILLGRYDAVMDVGDWWEHSGQIYEINGLMPYNGYERKATVVGYGRNPEMG